jgi:toxin FitB
MYLLDTNVISELRKSRAGSAHPGVVEWADDVPTALMFVSVISIHELEYGVLLAERGDAVKGLMLRTWLDNSVVPAFAHRILDVDLPVARQAAALHVPDPAPFRDALIGATALVHGMILVTRNVRDFDRFDDLEVSDPWGYERSS